MKVGVFHPSLYLNGGAEVVALAVTNTLARSGYDVFLYTDKRINQKETNRILGNPLHSSVKLVVNRSFTKARTLLDIYQNILKSAAFKAKCDILIDTYSNLFSPWTDICYTHFPFMNRCVYNTRFPYLKSSHLTDIGVLPYALFERNYVNNDNKQKLIIANSHFTAQAIKEFFKVNVNVLSPPVLSSFFKKSAVNTSRKDLVVTVSRLDLNKGLEKIPYIAKHTGENVKFVIIGLVQNQNVLKSFNQSIQELNLSHRVKVLTNISQHYLQKILNDAKVYLHTTVNEHFGISIAEGMAMGCIPVVHNSGGAKEFVPVDYVYNDVLDAAHKIEAAINGWTPNNAREMTQIAEKFNEEVFSKKFLELFEQYKRNKEANI